MFCMGHVLLKPNSQECDSVPILLMCSFYQKDIFILQDIKHIKKEYLGDALSTDILWPGLT